MDTHEAAEILQERLRLLGDGIEECCTPGGLVAWKEVEVFLTMAEEALLLKDQCCRRAINEAEKYKWDLEEEKDRAQDEAYFLENEMKKLSIEKSALQSRVQALEREAHAMKAELMLLKAQAADSRGALSPVTGKKADSHDTPVYAHKALAKVELKSSLATPDQGEPLKPKNSNT